MLQQPNEFADQYRFVKTRPARPPFGCSKSWGSAGRREKQTLDAGHYKSPKAPPARASAMKRIDLTGKRFGRWTVRAYAGDRKWSCLCDCGARGMVDGNELRRGKSKSCGCLARELAKVRATKTRDVGDAGIWFVDSHDGALFQSAPPTLRELRRPRNYGLRRLAFDLGVVCRHGGAPSGVFSRSNRQ
jgi:hypothetical protein